MTRALFTVTLVLAALSSGCEAEPARRAPAAAAAPDLNRSAAILAARSDARARYGDGWIAWVNAQQLGRYWVVERRAHDGKGLRYAISTADGSIRERRVFQ